ncbi:hypothetical protein, partial [Desulfovibrio sp.]|uniref:hypothetical protein n=1 Tax=Desulfovibrio sp. TaxID=885 RepID=UPI00307C3E18
MKKFFPPLFLWRNHASFPFSSDAGLQQKSLPKEAFHQGSVPLFWMAASKKSPMQAGRYLKYR